MPARLTFHLILHTHWDREWYLPSAGFRPRLVSALGHVLDLLEGDPASRFVLDGQTVLVEDALAVRPDWNGRIARAVAAEQLAVGPWYILADEIVPSGESLIRNLLQGAHDATALGRRMNVLYSPDAFGHPAILPTLAGEFGIDAAVVWRGLAPPPGGDRDLYRWAGPDQREITLYHLPPAGYEIGGELNAPLGVLAERWRQIRQLLVDRSVTSHVAVFVGADHHAPPTDPGAIRDTVQELEPDHEVRLSSIEEFLAAASGEPRDLSPIQGELRWSYGHTWTLQGTHATRARLKRRHGRIESHLQRMVEPLIALDIAAGADDRRALLAATSRMLLQCQFHDTLCGCCSDEVAREQATRLTSIVAANRELVCATVDHLCDHDPDVARDQPSQAIPTLLVWNPAARSRSGIVTAEVTCFRRDVLVGPPSGRTARTGPGYQPFVLATTDDVMIPVQVLEITSGTERVDAPRHYPDQDEVDRVRIAFVAPPTWGLGFTRLLPTPGTAKPPASGLEVRDRSVSNRFVEVRVEPDGRIDLLDRRSGEHYRRLLELVDERDLGDSYSPWIAAPPPMIAPGPLAVKVIAGGPLVGALEVRYVVPSAGRGEMSIRLVILLHADSPVVRVRLELDNCAVDHRLRVRLPVGGRSDAIAGSAFGFERRRVAPITDGRFAAETPPATAPAHRYVAAGAEGRGLAVLAPGFFEYEWAAENDLLVTALRSIGELSRGDLPSRPGHAGWPMPIPDAQEPGIHVMELGLVAVDGVEAVEIASLERFWEDTFVGPQTTFIRDCVGGPGRLPSIGIELEGSGLVFSALKPAEAAPGFIVRCYSTDAVPVAGRWIFRSSIRSATRVRADESVVLPLEVRDRHVVEFIAPPRGIVSILITPESS